MNKSKVIQKIINKKTAKTYLEIGVCSGACFFKIRAPRKIGVDIKFCLPGRRQMIKEYSKNLSNIHNKYYEMSSDDFFATHKGLFKKKKIDVAFIDGLHEYKQVIRDVNNCLTFLNENGVIILHDCNPSSALVATPFNSIKSVNKSSEWTGAWTGDVWKTVVYFRSVDVRLKIFVLDTDCGLCIITKDEAETMLTYSLKDIEKLSYEDLSKNRKDLLNLKELMYLEKFLATWFFWRPKGAYLE